jgi:hypothetical protein
MNYKEASNTFFGQYSAFIEGLSKADDHKMLVMPDCVNFLASNVMAWGEVNGQTTWIRYQYARHPRVIVHEMGHNLGMRHSGINSTYDDGTCYMGNKAAKSELGSRMCFNAAKMWYFGWYKDKHLNLNTMTLTSTSRTVTLAALDDIKNKVDVGSGKSILRISMPGSQEAHYIMFNKKKGINDQVVDYQDRVVIYEQNSTSEASTVVKDLGQGDSYAYNKTYGQTLWTLWTISVSTITDTAATMLVTFGDPTQKSPAPTASSCEDVKDWHDSDGAKYDCEWYSEPNKNRCGQYGGTLGNDGKTANEACCACKSATTPGPTLPPTASSCGDVPGWHDSDGAAYGCGWYSEQNR